MPEGHYPTTNTIARNSKYRPAKRISAFEKLVGVEVSWAKNADKIEGICIGSSAVWVAETVETGTPPTSLNLFRASIVQSASWSSSAQLDHALNSVNLKAEDSYACERDKPGVVDELLRVRRGASALFGISKTRDGVGHMMALHHGADRFWLLDPNVEIAWYTETQDVRAALDKILSAYPDLFPTHLFIRTVSVAAKG